MVASRKNASTENLVQKAWEITPAFWPLDRMIAINPLQGLDHLPFEKALQEGSYFFRQKEAPKPIEEANILSLKWLPLYFDQGQCTIKLPGKNRDLFSCLTQALKYDRMLTDKQRAKIATISTDPTLLITDSIKALEEKDALLFLQLMLTTLPGWASHVHYLHHSHLRNLEPAPHLKTIKDQYLALRILLFLLHDGDPSSLVAWHRQASLKLDPKLWIEPIKEIKENEQRLRKQLLDKIGSKKTPSTQLAKAQAQFIFCMDVRSEPFISKLENSGPYEVFSMPGFFSAAVTIAPDEAKEPYPSCPVLVTPSHQVEEKYQNTKKSRSKRYRVTLWGHRLFYNLKHTFSAPFALVETLGLSLGLWMALRTFFPKIAARLRKKMRKHTTPSQEVIPHIEQLPLKTRCEIASNSLKSIGLTKNFSQLVVICGHEGQSENNAFASVLNCGACGGQKGASNARILACILNQPEVRKRLHEEGIAIPEKTQFLPGTHNTTTDALNLFSYALPNQGNVQTLLEQIENDLKTVGRNNFDWRLQSLQKQTPIPQPLDYERTRSEDWAQVRPEWGLAKNHAIIIAPRSVSKDIDLEGRVFLHSYEFEKDPERRILTAILAAPLLVAHAINSQYLFSTLDNKAFGAGSKVTKNVTGKFSVMQGGCSDLMHGLPLQSVTKSDTLPYHEMARLTVVVRAPKQWCLDIIDQNKELKKLLENQWMFFFCFDPEEKQLISCY